MLMRCASVKCRVDNVYLGETYHVITRINHECCPSGICAELGQGTQWGRISSSTCTKTSSFPERAELVQCEQQGLS